jgi:predicted Fe-Mo cluster-binding NifX family protein
MVKAAFAYWGRRIAPVFDVARQIHLVEMESGRIVGEAQENLPDGLPFQKALCLVEFSVNTLVCGAISNPMHQMIAASGIQVKPFVAGDLGQVIQAWLSGNLEQDAFAMPGCCGHRRKRRIGGPPAGHAGSCRCIKCGHRQPHEPGMPYLQFYCPKCGATMTGE